jgi:two-component system OmpR family sensor kinase
MGRLFWKFFISIWLAQLVAVLGISGAIWIKDRNHAIRTQNIELGPPANFLLDASASILRVAGADGLRELLRQNLREQVYAVDDDGQEILGREVDPETLRQARELHARNGNLRALRTIEDAQRRQWLVFVGKRHHSAPPRPGTAAQSGRRPMHGDLPHFPFMPMIFALLASLASAAVLAWHFAKPIRLLRAAFDAAASGDLSTRVGPGMGKRRDELTDLARDFDRMAGRVQDLVEDQRRLLHDVSHELRSPLARLQAAVGLARQRPEKAAASFDRMERESARMNGMIGELLTLSRMEAGVPGAMDEVFAIDELVAAIVDDARFEAQALGKHVRLDLKHSALVRGSAELLQRAIENVVRNALRHTAPGTTVEIDIERDDGKPRVRVGIRDHGEGVPEQELDAIFRPFVKGSNASPRAEGHGLGLAIADRMIRAHQGAIHARNAAGGGLHVGIELPCCEGEA